MAYRLNSSHVCFVAKNAVLQARGTIRTVTPNILKPISRDVSCNESTNSVFADNGEHIDIPEKTGSMKLASYRGQNLSSRGRVEAERKFTQGDMIKIKEGLTHNYFTKLYNGEKEIIFTNSQSNKLKNFTCNDILVTPKVLKKKSVIGTQREIFKGCKLNNEVSDISPSSPIDSSETNIENGGLEYAEDNISTNSNTPSSFDTIQFAKCFECPSPSYSDILKSKVMKTNTQLKSNEHSDEDTIKVSKGSSNNRLFGSRINVSPLIGPQYLQENYVNLRSVCGMIKTNDSCSNISIRKVLHRKKKLPKMLPMKCPKVVKVPQMKSVPLIPLRRRYSPGDPLKCTKVLKNEPCQRADDNWKLIVRPFSKISDCPKVSQEFYIKPCASLPRLPKVHEPEVIRKCYKPSESCPSRSDVSLLPKKKKLPSIASGTYIQHNPKLTLSSPIRRLDKISVLQPPKSCPEPSQRSCPNRADDEICVAKKTLPCIKSPCAPPSPIPQLIDCPKYKRLKPHDTKISRICRDDPNKFVCPTRSDKHEWVYDTGKPWERPTLTDSSYPNGPKTNLPKYKSSSCFVSLDAPKLKDGTPLKRPRKKSTPQNTTKPCTKPKAIICDRSDWGLQVSQKQLPKIEAGRKQSEPVLLLQEGRPIKRLEKVLIPEPPKICSVSNNECVKRSDDCLKTTKHTLPKLSRCFIPPTQKEEKKPATPLQRLPKQNHAEPKRICQNIPKKACIRADDSLVTTKKGLPELKKIEHPVVDVVNPKDSPPLKRLIFKTCEQKCKEAKKSPPKCMRSDTDDWEFICERRCIPRRDTCYDKKQTGINGKRSMSTNLSDFDNKGLLTRRAQLSHIDIRKRYSTEKKSISIAPSLFGKSYPIETNSNEQSSLQKIIEPIEFPSQIIQSQIENDYLEGVSYLTDEYHISRGTCCDNKKVNSSYSTSILLPRSHNSKPCYCLYRSFSEFNSQLAKIAGKSNLIITDHCMSRSGLPFSSKSSSGSSSSSPCQPQSNSCSHCPQIPKEKPPSTTSACSHCPPPPQQKSSKSSSCSHCPQYPPKEKHSAECSHCPKYPPKSACSSHCPTYPPRSAPVGSSQCSSSSSRKTSSTSCSTVSCPNPPQVKSSRSSLCPSHSADNPRTKHSCSSQSSNFRSRNSSCTRSSPPLCPPCCPPLFNSPTPCPARSSKEITDQNKVLVRRKACPTPAGQSSKRLSLWQRLKNYFKARPNCPPASEYKKRKIMRKLQNMADKAGLAIYDPADDPYKICQEVERRCLARQNASKGQKRCYGTTRHYTTFPSVIRLSFFNEGALILTRYLTTSRCNFSFCSRTLSNWKNPIEFYGFDLDDDDLETCSNEFDELHKASCEKAIYLYSTYGGLDFDGLKENMCKSLWMTSLLASNPDEDELRESINYLLECCSDNVKVKREILLQVWRKVSKELETKSHKNKVGLEEVDTSKDTIELIEKIITSKTRR